jgi:uncharacterized protein
MSLPFRILLAITVTALLVWWGMSLAAEGGTGRDLALSLALGAAFGVVLQRARFCFLCNFRDFLNVKDPRGLLAILIALAVGAIGYTAIFGAWLPIPLPERLPPTAHIGPVSLILPVAAFIFGIGMALSGSCLSAHFYRLGEGSPTSPFALMGAAIGFGIGFITWNSLFLSTISTAQTIWLPHVLGYMGSLGATLALVAFLALMLLKISHPVEDHHNQANSPPVKLALQRLFVERWPAGATGILVGMISTLAYFRVTPLGVTAELGSIARTAGNAWSLLPETLFGLDGFRGCATVIKQALLSNNGVFVIGLVSASFASALFANQFKPKVPTAVQIGNGLAGGMLMGWGAMTALGCTVGVLLSGIHAGALAGWVFLFACGAGIFATLKLKTVLAKA